MTTAYRCLTAAMVAFLLGATPISRAQEATIGGTNDLMQADDSSGNDTSQGTDSLQDDEGSTTNLVAGTNQPVAATPDGRTRRKRRQVPNRSRDSLNNRAPRPASAGTNDSASSLDYSAFRLVVDRNIFDPNRAPRMGRPANAQPRTVDSFTLVGTMSYDKGVFAFFDGTSSDYKKAVKQDESIAGYKIAAISSDSVKLAQATNVVELAVGTQMRKREDGTWEKGSSSESYAATPSSGSTAAPTAASGADNDVLKKMMMRREKE